MTTSTLHPTAPSPQLLMERFVEYLRTFRAPAGLFHPDVVCTYHVPGGHYEQRTPAGLEAELAPYGDGSDVEVKGWEATPTGFVLEFTQRSRDGVLYEELAWARLDEGLVRTLSVYCTGAIHDA